MKYNLVQHSCYYTRGLDKFFFEYGTITFSEYYFCVYCMRNILIVGKILLIAKIYYMDKFIFLSNIFINNIFVKFNFFMKVLHSIIIFVLNMAVVLSVKMNVQELLEAKGMNVKSM